MSRIEWFDVFADEDMSTPGSVAIPILETTTGPDYMYWLLTTDGLPDTPGSTPQPSVSLALQPEVSGVAYGSPAQMADTNVETNSAFVTKFDDAGTPYPLASYSVVWPDPARDETLTDAEPGTTATLRVGYVYING